MKDKRLKQYLGDSVYADFNGYHIVLTTENGLPTDPSNRIAIEPDVLNALNRYRDWLKEIFKESREAIKSEEEYHGTEGKETRVS